MDPFLLGALMRGGGAVIQGVGDYAEAENAFGKSEEERLKLLKRREELGTLGFTGQEQNRIMRSLLNPVQAREAERAIQTRQILGAGDLGASQSAIANLIQGDKEEAARAGASETYLQEQMKERKAQEAELRGLEKDRQAAEAAKTQAIIRALSLGLGGVGEEYQTKLSKQEEEFGDTAHLSDEDLESIEVVDYIPGD